MSPWKTKTPTERKKNEYTLDFAELIPQFSPTVLTASKRDSSDKRDREVDASRLVFQLLFDFTVVVSCLLFRDHLITPTIKFLRGCEVLRGRKRTRIKN